MFRQGILRRRNISPLSPYFRCGIEYVLLCRRSLPSLRYLFAILEAGCSNADGDTKI